MNKIFKVVWNASQQCYQAVSEISKSHTSTSSSTQTVVSGTPIIRWSIAAVISVASMQALAAPTDGVVTAGTASISQSGTVTEIHQSTPKAAINWQSFGIQAGETVNFRQPDASSITLNRVIGNEKSVIDGALNANGKVFISNPNGAIIGKNAQINVGTLVATTGRISDDDFMGSDNSISITQSKGEIINQGNIAVPKGGAIALLAPVVKNTGKITSHEADVLLASAEEFYLTLPGTGGFSYSLSKGTLEGLVDNGGAILADGGRVILTARGLDTVRKSVIKHSGSIEAKTVNHKNGVIELVANEPYYESNTRLEVTGSLKAEAPNGGEAGFIETRASEVKIADTAIISTDAPDAANVGSFKLYTADELTVADGDSISGTQLSKILSKSNAELGIYAYRGNIRINTPLAWNKNTLTLGGPKKENTIYFDKSITGTDKAKLALNVAHSGDGGAYVLRNNSKINLPTGPNFSIIGYTNNGDYTTRTDYEVIHELPTPQPIDESWNGSYDKFAFYTATNSSGETYTATKNIALGADLDASKLPANHYQSRFYGLFHGLGHDVNNLKVNVAIDSASNTTVAGLFGRLDGTIRDLTIKNGSVSITKTPKLNTDGYIMGNGAVRAGLLAGLGFANVYNVHATGKVSATTDSYAYDGKAYAGGLIGENSRVYNSSFEGDVSAVGVSEVLAGGISGYGANVHQSYATGTVTATSKLYANPEKKSYSTGHAYAGGLVGKKSAIHQSMSESTVTATAENGDAFAGGLVGYKHYDSIGNSYANSTVSASAAISYNPENKNLTARAAAGGLAGHWTYNDSRIENSYALGSVSAKSNQQDAHQGGLVGYYPISTGTDPETITFIKRSFFDVNNSGATRSIGNLNTRTLSPTKKDATDLKDANTYGGWDFDKVWRLDKGDTPRLRALTKAEIGVDVTELSVGANHISKVYDGAAVNYASELMALAKANGHDHIVSVTGLLDGDTLDKLRGSLKYGGTWQGARDAGSYTISPYGLNGGQKYSIKYTDGSLTINQRPVTATLIGERVYDSQSDTAKIDDKTKINQDGIVYRDVDKAKITGTVKLAGKDAGKQAITDSSTVTITGDAAKNYKLTTVTGFWNIKPADIVISSLALKGKRQYDGTHKAYASDVKQSELDNALQAGDKGKVALTGTGLLDSANVGTRKLTNLGTLALTGDAAKNYTISMKDSVWTLTPAPLTIQALPDTKVYDGTTKSNKRPAAVGTLYGSDKLTSATQAFTSKNVLGEKTSTLTPTAWTIEDGNGGNNYVVEKKISSGTITPAPLVVTALPDTKVYDGTTKSNKTPIVDKSQLREGDYVFSATQEFASKDVKGQNGSELKIKSVVVEDGNGGHNYKILSASDVGQRPTRGEIKPKKLRVQMLNNFAFDFSTASRNNIGFLAEGMVAGEKVSPDVTVSYTNDKTINGITEYEIGIAKNGIQMSKGDIRNYDVEVTPGSLIILPGDAFNMKHFPKNDAQFANNPDITYIATRLSESQDERILSDVVYDADLGDARLAQMGAKLSRVGEIINLPNGLQMTTYKHQDQDKYIIAYRGTEQFNDLTTDLETIWTTPEQYSSAFVKSVDIINNIKQSSPNAEIVLTGHSLGGNLAQYVAARSGERLKSITFNPAPIRLQMYHDLLANSECGSSLCNKDLATSFRFDNEFLLQLNPHLAKLGIGDENTDVKTNGLIGSSLYTNFLTQGLFTDHKTEHMSLVNNSLLNLNENKEIINASNGEVIRNSSFEHIIRPTPEQIKRNLADTGIHAALIGIMYAVDVGGTGRKHASDLTEKAGKIVIDTGRKAGEIAAKAGEIAVKAGEIAVKAGEIAVKAGEVAGRTVIDTGRKAGEIAVKAGEIAGETWSVIRNDPIEAWRLVSCYYCGPVTWEGTVEPVLKSQIDAFFGKAVEYVQGARENQNFVEHPIASTFLWASAIGAGTASTIGSLATAPFTAFKGQVNLSISDYGKVQGWSEEKTKDTSMKVQLALDLLNIASGAVQLADSADKMNAMHNAVNRLKTAYPNMSPTLASKLDKVLSTQGDQQFLQAASGFAKDILDASFDFAKIMEQ